MEILIVEDDVSFALELQIFFEKHNPCKLTVANSFRQGSEYLQSNKWELVMLDLTLEGVETGDVLAKQAHDLKIPFIVVTAHKELEKLEKIKKLKPLGYFTKPLDKLSLEYLLFNNFSADHRGPLENHQKQDSFLIKIKSKWETVHFNDALYFQVKGNYVEIHMKDRIITYRSSLASLINQINGSQFIRLHRNYFVNKKYITGYDLHKKLIDLGDTIKLPVSRNYRRNLKGVLNQV